MIHRKEFYFVRHGQTDYNTAIISTDHHDIPLNAHGKNQALAIEPLIASLPIQTVCYSPMRRAKETKEIVARNLKAENIEIPKLAECTLSVWLEMTSLKGDLLTEASNDLRDFIHQVQDGVNQALLSKGPILIVAHGGVHYALSSLLNVEHQKAIDHCVPVHFTYNPNAKWKATILKELV